MSKIDNEFKINIPIETYFEQLKLMEQQYGQEEALYPWIFMMLIDKTIKQNLSLLSAANADWAGDLDSRKLLRGFSGFPDLCIVDKDFPRSNMEFENEEKYKGIYGCIEAKKLTNSLFDLDKEKTNVKIGYQNVITIKPSNRSNYGWYRKLENKDENEKIIIKHNSGKNAIYEWKELNSATEFSLKHIEEISNEKEIYLCKNINSENDNQWEYFKNKIIKKEKNIKQFFKADAVTFFKLEKGVPVIKINNEAKIHPDLLEVIGELLWYGKVIYTNGLKWKYIEVTKCESQPFKIENIVDLRETLYYGYVNVKEPKERWYKEIEEMNLEIEVYCKDIVDLSTSYEEYKKNHSCQDTEWKQLIDTLDVISWTAQSNKNAINKVLDKYVEKDNRAI